jgi:hypothetical protein
MPRVLPLLAGAVSIAVLSVVLIAASPVTANEASAQERPDIYVTVNGCGTDSIYIKVDPWVAPVRRGQPARWHPPEASIDSMVVQAKDPHSWPFQWAPPGRAQRRPTLPGRALQAGVAQGRDQERYAYSILVYCGKHVIDIDPEVVIVDPMGPE